MNTIPFTWPKGFSSDGVHAHLRHNPTKPDLGWIVSSVPAAAAGVYTRNQFQAAPVQLTKATIKQQHQLQAIVANSANANSYTGSKGAANAAEEQQLVATQLNIAPELVGVASTGIIGHQLDMPKIKAGLTKLQLTDTAEFAQAIMTTDTHSKTISLQFKINGTVCTISGVAKGSGMIHPNMGTMLCFITTDAKIDGQLLQQLLSAHVESTFNQITVDGDTSTNDMVLVMANGQSGAAEITIDNGLAEFTTALHAVMEEMAKQIAGDGEGATKLLEADVTGAADALQARMAAKAVIGSNLVKAAMFGQDPNWGRIIDALGNTDVQLAASALSISINKVPMVIKGQPQDLSLPAVQQAMTPDTVKIAIDLGVGDSAGQAWGADLTYEYVHINAAYSS
ncbi:bifunctional glutamate N-acetyltransferase/amino-acid acetyltransferase ArgJ [Lacticaseibacillus zhaodongensis]|uniref:bifunctional glutamate N-acetyltransferase/amino-acid acetyltransferase ArgJ n=1 Tax=Lacticaseibacillus zhaodongensis TaxID=2668065 RepID=UPI0012D2D209|nr:bifunctional glutamate N-acetyltransferase/amino-acid acetyltransferase ArgJ [Lacticaseibacillus zhaodongensis]